MYALVLVSTVIENLIPPIPADILVTLSAFLTHASATTSLGIFLASWGGAAIGAVLVYLLARRFGRPFFASALGRRLLAPEAIAGMERDYLRFGVGGIFLARLLPGLRSVVAPFTGLVSLPPVKALAPMIVASAIWYGALTILGARVGAEWDTIKRVLAHLNTGMGIVAVAFGLVLVTWAIIRRRRQRRERLWEAFHRAFAGDPTGEALSHHDPAVAAVGGLLLELARTDHQLDPEDRAGIVAYVKDRWQLPDPGEVEQIDPAEFARVLGARYGRTHRVGLARRLWWHGFGDGLLRKQEDRVMRRVAELLGLSQEDLREARRAEDQ